MFKNIDPKTRGLIYLLIVIAVLVLLFFVVKWVKKYLKDQEEKKDPKIVVEDADDEYKAQIKAGIILSNPPSAYSGASNAIESLMDGCETFESEMNSIKEVIKVVKQPIDWFFLLKTFGVREIDNCGPFTGSKQYDLSSLLKDQLDSSGAYKITNINGYSDYSFFTQNSLDVLENFLKSRGVTF